MSEHKKRAGTRSLVEQAIQSSKQDKKASWDKVQDLTDSTEHRRHLPRPQSAQCDTRTRGQA